MDSTTLPPRHGNGTLNAEELDLAQRATAQITRGVEVVASEWLETFKQGGADALAELPSFRIMSEVPVPGRALRGTGFNCNDSVPLQAQEFYRQVQFRFIELRRSASAQWDVAKAAVLATPAPAESGS